MKKIKTINVNELQSGASKVIKDVQEGKSYQVMRYSEPAAYIISSEEYQCLTGECRGCVKDLLTQIKTKNSKLKT